MKASLALAVMLAWQAAGQGTGTLLLREQRPISVPAGRSGQACVALDAAVYAHAAERSARDLRLFATGADGVARETPYAISESDAQPGDVMQVAATNVTAHGSDLSFDLTMPARPYSAVELDLPSRTFVGLARVQGISGMGQPPVALGSMLVFDLTAQHQARSTTLSLAEARYPRLHVSLHLMQPDGHPLGGVTAAMLPGASVPPSREAQVLYTTVAQSSAIVQDGQDSVIRFASVPEHVPVERVVFSVPDSARAGFRRGVTITATPQDASGEAETLHGEISQMHRPGAGDAPEIRYAALALDATLGATLAAPAEVEVRIHNGTEPPLPLTSVALEMRRRSLCFEAAAGDRYTLTYGDDSLGAPFYPYARSFTLAANALQAQLGPEQAIPTPAPAITRPTYRQRHPEALMLAVLILIAGAGLVGLESVKRQRHR